MSKIFVSNWITLDGIFAGPNGETDWFTFDTELENYNLSQLRKADTILFGRTTYEMMKDFWPTDAAKNERPEVIKYMNDSAKHTFSKTVTQGDWANSYFHKEITEDTIARIKEGTHKDIVVLGSGQIARQLHHLKLIDEYHIMLDPQVKADGSRFFDGFDAASLQLKDAKAFECGVVFLTYSVIK